MPRAISRNRWATPVLVCVDELSNMASPVDFLPLPDIVGTCISGSGPGTGAPYLMGELT